MKKKETILETAKKYIRLEETKIKKSQTKQFIYFVLGFLIFYLVLTALAESVPTGTFEAITGESVNSIMRTLGFNTSTHTGEVFTLFLENKQIGISWLCAGVLEIIILISAILSSFGVSWKKKIIGSFIAIIVGYFFNLARIIITIFLILNTSTTVFELAHDLLFRLLLFGYIVIFYILWFHWAMKKEK